VVISLPWSNRTPSLATCSDSSDPCDRSSNALAAEWIDRGDRKDWKDGARYAILVHERALPISV
jgi:hypothetical protein